jgi:flagellar biosynthesis/type III secretory pathway protein FliH
LNILEQGVLLLNYNTAKIVTEPKIQSNSSSELERLKCFEQLRGLANLRNLQPLIEQLMQSISQYLNREIDPWYKEGKEEGIEIGTEKGIEKGIQIGTEKGIEKGIQIGTEKGIQLGEQRKSLELILNLLTSTDFDDARIAALAAVSEDFVKEIRMKYSKD